MNENTLALDILLPALADNSATRIEIVDSNGMTSLITLSADGYEQLDQELLSRTVQAITIHSLKQLTIQLTALNPE